MAKNFAKSRAALEALSQRTGTALPSIITSFAILHELTAIIPLVGFFYTARTLGVGELLLSSLDLNRDPSAIAKDPDSNWLKQKASQWITEGEQRAHRIGKRYKIAGLQEDRVAGKLTGDIANAVVAYGATKALLPLRIGLSLWLAPAFSRRVIDPIGSLVMRVWRR